MTSACVAVDGKWSGDKTAHVWRLDIGAHVHSPGPSVSHTNLHAPVYVV